MQLLKKKFTLKDSRKLPSIKGKTVLITGASSGIGAAVAKKLAQQGYNLVLTARRSERLDKLKMQLEKDYRINVECIALDLAQQSAARILLDEIEKRRIVLDGCINNCGLGWSGNFINQSIENIEQQITTQITALTELCRFMLPSMIKKQSGFIINISSIAAFQPVPYFSVYAAVKAYILSFTVAIAEELRGTGVRVACVCPGSTRTEFQKIADTPPDEKPVGGWSTVEQVAQSIIDTIDSKKIIVIPGIRNRLATIATKFLSRKTIAAISGSLYNPKNR